MVLTKERAEVLAEVLTTDEERGKMLLSLKPAEALAQINALGNDFTLDEINKFGDVLNASQSKGELDEASLDNVAGGFVITGAMLACAAIGVALGVNWGYGKRK